MTAWGITALIIICGVLTAICASLIVYVHELRADLDLATSKLVEILERRGDPRKLISGLNGYAKRY